MHDLLRLPPPDDVLKRRLWFASIALVLLLVAAVGVWLGRPAYRHWKEQRFLAQAQAFLAKSDFASASLSAREVLSLNPSNLAACQLMCTLAERIGSPAVLDWRRRIAELSPTPENQLLLAATALRLQRPPYSLATQILDRLRLEATNLPAFHAVSADLAMRLNQLDQARLQFEAAARLEPTNPLHTLNLATLRLASTNAALAADGRAMLEGLSSSTNVGAVALRSLISDSIRRKDLATALAWSAQLIAGPRCTCQDRLRHLELLLRTKAPEFTSCLETLKQSASTNAADVGSVSEWLIQHDRAGDGLRWLTNLPPALRARPPVPLAITETYAALTNWSAIQHFLADQQWGDTEFLRLAFLSQAALQKKEMTSATIWRTAVSGTGDRLGPQIVLLNLAENWHRIGDKEDLLWDIYRHHPSERWALNDLDRLYKAQTNTLGLNKVLAALAAANPNDFAAANNFAATSLLLNLNNTKAYEVARRLHSEHPNDAIIASTYAFALHLRGKTAEGLAVLQKLKPQDLEDPSVALYYGVLLSASGQPAEAKKYLALGQRGSLLPEEKQLLEAARKAI